MLKSAIILTIYVLVHTIRANKFCNFQSDYVTDQCYKREILATLPHSPNQIAVDRFSNVLYFSFDSGMGEYIPGKLKIGNNTLYVLKGIKDAFAMASDFDNGDLYFGGSHGIYKYNQALKSLKRLAIQNLDIWWLVIRRKIYFIKFPSLSVFKYENRNIRSVEQLRNHTVHQFVFDNDDNIYFINDIGLFGIKSGTQEALLLKDHPKFIGMATDNRGFVYLCSEDGIYTISKVMQRVKRVVSIEGVLGMTFDQDNNIIYSDSHEIVRLIAKEKMRIVYNDDLI